MLLLLGPFVDAEHPLAQAGTLQDSFDDIFATQVHDLLNIFALLCECLHTVLEIWLAEQIGTISSWLPCDMSCAEDLHMTGMLQMLPIAPKFRLAHECQHHSG